MCIFNWAGCEFAAFLKIEKKGFRENSDISENRDRDIVQEYWEVVLYSSFVYCVVFGAMLKWGTICCCRPQPPAGRPCSPCVCSLSVEQ